MCLCVGLCDLLDNCRNCNTLNLLWILIFPFSSPLSYSSSIQRTVSNSTVLGQYVVALLNQNFDEDRLKADLLQKLEVFLEDSTSDFVNELFQHLDENGIFYICNYEL